MEIPDEIIPQIRASPAKELRWCEAEMGPALKNIFPITPESCKTRKIPLDHPAWGLTPNPWWSFITDIPLISWEEFEALSKQRNPSVRAHFDESGWVIQERMLVDRRGLATALMGNHPMLKLIQFLKPVEKCDVLISCREDVEGMLMYMMIWKPEWKHSKDLLRSLGWSMVEAVAMSPSRVEVLMDEFIKMNILMWNCRGALNPDFKRRVFEMVVNHHPSIMVITETRVGGSRAEKIIEGLPFDGFITTKTIGYVGGLWILWRSEDADVKLLSATKQKIHATVKVCASNLSWLFIAIYPSRRLTKHRILWSNIEKVGQLHNLPWLMIGDFNEILGGEDKFKGNQINLNRALRLKNVWIRAILLILGLLDPSILGLIKGRFQI